MRWPWDRDPELATPKPITHSRDNAGLEQAQKALDHALSRWPDVTRVAEDMRTIRRRNHLAEQVHEALGRHAK